MSVTTRSATIAPARRSAYVVIRRVFEQGAYTDRALGAERQGLQPRDRALAMALAYGTVQRAGTLDHIAQGLLARPPAELDPPVLAGLRLGLFQILYMDGVADHAAVNDSVELTKRASRGGAALVNAVLRRATREGSNMLAALDDRTPSAAATAHSVPSWLAERWWQELGADVARGLLRQVNLPAEAALRVNTLLATADQVVTELPVRAEPAPGLGEAILLDGPFDAAGSKLWREGAIMPQSRASMLVSRILDPPQGARVLDLCAAPGAKTTHLAALIGNRTEVIAVERHAGRAAALERTSARMDASCVQVRVDDAAARHEEKRFDAVLVDPPCSGLGTLQSRPDLRWRASPDGIEELAALQSRILAAGAAATEPGGALVYSVCTISRAEGEDVVIPFLERHPQFELDDLGSLHPELRDARMEHCLQLLPHRDLTDGFFIARLRRK